MDLFFSKEECHEASKLSQSIQRSQVHKEQPEGGSQEEESECAKEGPVAVMKSRVCSRN